MTSCLILLILSIPILNGKRPAKVPQTRIINGDKLDVKYYNHHVRIDLQNVGFICGGTIIGRRTILTAAHCVHSPHIKIRVGVNTIHEKGTLMEIQSVITHPKYDSISYRHDLAVVLLKKNLHYTKRVGKADLATHNGHFPQVGGILGWGCTDCIWFVPAWICSFSPASTQLRGGLVKLEKHIGHMFKSESRVKACPGDSGGPLVTKDGKIIGVISHLDRLFFKQLPTYYMSVPDHLTWIKNHTLQ